MALVTGTPEHKIRVIAPDVGGGFGGKLQFTPEEVITFLLARHLGKPVKYTETRSESMLSGHHGRDQIQQVTLVAKRDGTVRGLKVELLVDMGAYLGLVTPGIPLLGAYLYNSIYKFAAYKFVCTTVFTNKTWTDAYRGAGRPEATFAIERMMDALAAELGRDPLEVREQNWIQHEEFPFTTVAGVPYDSGNYEAATAKAKELFDYDGLRAEQAERRERKDPVQLGIGISTYTEMCGWAPSRLLGQLSYVGGGWEHAQIRMLPTGKVEVVVGVSPHGQGNETTFSQIVADRLGVPFEDVEILHGDTQVSPRGLDTYGSRSVSVAGPAIHYAVDKVIEKAKQFAAHLLEASADDIEFDAGKLTVRGTDKGTTLAAVAFAVFDAHNLPPGIEPNLDAEAAFDPQEWSVPHGTHLCADRGGHRDRAVADPPLRRRRRRRDRRQPPDRRRPGPWRHRAGRGAGAVRGGLPRRVRHADDRDASPTTTCRAPRTCPAGRRTAPSRPSTTNPLGVKGVGETGHDRGDPGRGERDRRRVAPLGRGRHRDAGDADAGVAGDPARRDGAVVAGPPDRDAGRGAAGRRPSRRGRDRPGVRGGAHRGRRERRQPVIPAQFDYESPASVEEALSLLASAGDREVKVLAGGQSLLPVLRLRMAAPELDRRPRPHRRSCVGSATRATSSPSAR